MAREDALSAYKEMTDSIFFKNPISHKDLNLTSYEGIITYIPRNYNSRQKFSLGELIIFILNMKEKLFQKKKD